MIVKELEKNGLTTEKLKKHIKNEIQKRRRRELDLMEKSTWFRFWYVFLVSPWNSFRVFILLYIPILEF
jgi:hypothetical protein